MTEVIMVKSILNCKYIILLLIGMGVFGSDLLASEVLKTATLVKYPYTAEERLSGVSGMCVSLLAKSLEVSDSDVTVEFESIRNSKTDEALRAGRIDCVPYLADTLRNQNDFVLSPFTFLIVNADIICSKSFEYPEVQDLTDDRIGFIKDDIAATAYIELLGLNRDSVVWYDDCRRLSTDVFYNKIECGFVSDYICDGKPHDDLNRSNAGLSPVRITLGFRRGLSRGMINKVVTAVMGFRRDYPDEYYSIVTKYLPDSQYDHGFLIGYSCWYLIVAGGVVLVLIAVLILVRKRLKNLKYLENQSFIKLSDDLYYILHHISIPLILYDFDAVGSDKYIMNSAASEIFSQRAGEFDFDNEISFISSSDSVTARIRNLSAGQQDVFFVRINNSSRNKYEMVAIALPSGDRVFISLHNRSDEEFLLDSLKESQYALELATEAGKVGVFEINLNTQVMSGTNQFFANLGLGFIEQGISYSDFLKRVSFKNSKEARTDYQNLIDGKIQTCDIKFEVIDDSGCPVWMRLNAKAISRNSDGVAIELAGVLINIDRIQKLNLELEEYSRNFELIMKNSPDIIYFKDVNYKFIWASFSTLKVLGFSTLEEFIGKDDYDIHQREFAEGYNKIERDVILKGESRINYEQKYRNHNGEIRWTLSTKVPVRNADGEIIGLLGTGKDITRYKKILETLNNSQRIQSVGKLAGGIAHEFNNALNGIMGFAHILQESANLDDQEKDFVKFILDGTGRCEELTRHLLAFARKGKYVQTLVNVHEMIDSTLDIIRHSISDKIDIYCDYKASKSMIHADKSQIENVIINLITNAEYAIEEEGHICIETSNVISPEINNDLNNVDVKLPQSIQIKIIDDGVGIPQENLDKIFDPFFTTKKVGEGAGLGLSAVYGIINNHSGTIGVESDVGEGTCVTVILPLLS